MAGPSSAARRRTRPEVGSLRNSDKKIGESEPRYEIYLRNSSDNGSQTGGRRTTWTRLRGQRGRRGRRERRDMTDLAATAATGCEVQCCAAAHCPGSPLRGL